MSEHLTRKQLQDALDSVIQGSQRVQISVKQSVYAIKITELSTIDEQLIGIQNRLTSLGIFVDGDIKADQQGQNSWNITLKLRPVADINDILKNIGTHLDVKDRYLKENFGRYYRIEGASLAAVRENGDFLVPCLYFAALPVSGTYLSPMLISALQVSRYITLGNKVGKAE